MRRCTVRFFIGKVTFLPPHSPRASQSIDFLDTFFMVVRSSWSQFSFLHTYHHASIFATYWWVANTGYTGDVWFPIMLNSAIHFVMYFYYLSATFGIRPRWGQRLTEFQMIQFVTMMVHGGFMIYWNCAYPQVVAKQYVGYIFLMLLLFANFYVYKYFFGGKGKAGGGEGGSGSGSTKGGKGAASSPAVAAAVGAVKEEEEERKVAPQSPKSKPKRKSL